MKQLVTLACIFLWTGSSAWSQMTARITGSVKDGQGNVISAATVSLHRAKDSGLVKVAISDKQGIYEFLKVKEGSYFISATSVGFVKSNSSVLNIKSAEHQVPELALSPVSKNMNNVTVTARKPFVETMLDRTVVNVDASPTSAGSTALELLEKSPGVMVNNDGAISLRGKQGVIVMMDGKPTYLSAADLATMLRNMPASALDQIEIMTNPSSKYDASGNSGIINIKTKKR